MRRAANDKKIQSTGLMRALALREPSGAVVNADFDAQITEVAAIWPFTLLVQLCAAITMILTAHPTSDHWMTISIYAQSLLCLAFGLTGLAMLRVRRLRRLPLSRQVWAAMGYGSGIAATLVLLLWDASMMPHDRAQIASLVAVLGAMGGTVFALQPLRAAMFAFATTIAVSLLFLAGLSLGTGIAFLCLASLALATRRLAFEDAFAREQAFADYRHGQLAANLVREFEANGTGWFWQTDRDGHITYLTDKIAQVIANHDQPAIGRPLTAVFQLDSGNMPGTERTLGFHLSSRTSFSDYGVRPAVAGGADRWWSISGRPVIDTSGRFQGFIGSGADLTERRRAEAEITRLALFDGLTGLANRQRMRASLDQALSQPGLQYRPTALFLLDLDRFKVVNDTMGHLTGDALLKQVAQRLTRAVGDAGLVGRLGGDEFKVILPGENDPDRLGELARTIINSLSHPYSINGTSVTIGCSIGVAIAPVDGRDSETLVRNADLALYAAKAEGRGVHRFYREELLEGAQNRKRLEDDLRHALIQNQFHLVYQPVVSTESARIVGYEALIRWEHPTRGMVSPAEFIPVAEESGMIEAIGEWVLRTACLDAAGWPNDVRVGVNVSPIQFANPGLPAIITNALAKSGIAPHRLELEITEGVFLHESQSTDAMFKSLKGLGVRLALDDFGTGYSSLGYLKSAPFDKIKIDQSFVRGAAIDGSRNAAIIKAIVTLAGTLDMETTAEGVETQDEIELIRNLGCSHIQGYVYGKPVRAPLVGEMLETDNGVATVTGFRTSRPRRTALIRSATVEIGESRGEVRIRNISPQGAMIEGVEFAREPVGVPVRLEVTEGRMLDAVVRWARDGKAGLEFAERFDLDTLAAPAEARARKAG